MPGLIALAVYFLLWWVYDDVLDKVLHYPLWARMLHGIAFGIAVSYLMLSVAKTLGIPL